MNAPITSQTLKQLSHEVGDLNLKKQINSQLQMNRRYPKPQQGGHINNGKGAITAVKKENLSTAKTAVTNYTLHS